MKLFLIRHAESANNRIFNDMDYEKYLEQRAADPPITELGQQQAQQLAHYLERNDPPEQRLLRMTLGDGQEKPLSGYAFTKLYCSPMLRTLQTTWPISQALGMAPEIWTDIFEFGGLFHGISEGNIVSHPGLTREEITEKFPGYQLPATVTEQGWWTDGQEDETAAYARAMRVAKQILAWSEQDDYEDERIAMVIHGTFMSYLIKNLFDLNAGVDSGKTAFYHHFNTAVTRIDFLPDGQLMLRYLNRARHLESSMASV